MLTADPRYLVAAAIVILLPCQGTAAERLYVTSSLADVVSVIDTTTREIVGEIAVGYDPYEIAASPDGARVYVTTDFGLTVIDTATNSVVATVELPARAWSVSVSPDSSRAYVAADGADFYEVDADTLAVRAVPFGVTTQQILTSPDGGLLYVLHARPPGVPRVAFAVIDADTRELVRSVGLFGVSVLAVDPAGDALATLTASAVVAPQVTFLRPRTGTTIRQVPYSGPLGALEYHPDGVSLVLWNADKVVFLDPASGEIFRSLTVPRAGDVAVSPGGLVYALSDLYSAVLVLDPTDETVDSPLLAAIPVPVLVERMALADVPESGGASGGGCDAGRSAKPGPGVVLLALAALSLASQRGRGRARRSRPRLPDVAR